MLKHTKVSMGLAGILSIASFIQIHYTNSNQVSASEETTNFTVNVANSLAVSITTPVNGATGNVNVSNSANSDFLRNAISLSVFSNISGGYTASMYASGSTNLTHENNAYIKEQSGSSTDITLPTLESSSTRSAFPANHWGYSLEGTQSYDVSTYGETDAGSASSTYHPLVSSTSSPITILKSTTSGSSSRNVYFGAKAGVSQPSGTYSGTVVISVVTGTVTDENDNPNNNPITPTNPAQNQSTATNNPSYAYDLSNNRTVYTSVSTDTNAGTETTTTIVSSGDTTASYAPPAGETISTVASVSSGAPAIASGLAIAAGVAATSGLLFFVLAKGSNGNDEDE